MSPLESKLVAYDSSEEEEEEKEKEEKKECTVKERLGSKRILGHQEESQVDKRPRETSTQPAYPEKAQAKGEEGSATHQGRVRSFPHIKGNWAIHIHIPVQPSEDMLSVEQPLLEHIEKISGTTHPTLHSSPSSERSISLARIFTLQIHQIDPFLRQLRQLLQDVEPCSVAFDADPCILANDTNTRFFLCHRIRHGAHQLSKMVQQVDEAVKIFGHEPYYTPPIFHSSFAWSLDPIPNDAIHQAQRLLTSDQEDVMSCYAQQTHLCSQIRVRCGGGKRVYTILLSSKKGNHSH
ncbi:MAG: hypothetical protein DHS80DRAFT_31949 [Piptocephalis tieghemiana]|nr:MAG: hypothetical protein DHS80DRAFT_31949 [Piptocephalis tieghemiana]